MIQFVFRVLVILFLSSSFFGAYAQNGVKIDFDIKNYPSDTLLLGYYYGDRTLVLDTLISADKGKFSFERDTLLPSGVYLALYQPSNNYFQFMLNQEDQEFKLKGDYNGTDLKPKGSKDNELFYDYMNFISIKSQEKDALLKEIEAKKAKGEDVLKLEKEREMMDAAVLEKQKEIIAVNPKYITGLLLKSNLTIDIPEFKGSEKDISIQRYHYYKDHYFDHIELDNPATLRTPFLEERVNYFIEKLTPKHPDSIYNSIDYILQRMESAPETFQFYTSTFLNRYANSNIIGFDAIYVKLVDDYYSKGRTNWITDENLKKFEEQADKLRPILIGKQAPEITFYDEENNPVNLYDIDANFTIMIFWKPDCGHCKKAMPGLTSFYEKYNKRGVEVMAICTKHRDKYEKCWDFVKEKKLPFLNVGDQYHRSDFHNKYNVVSTPRVFILDKDKKIILKRVPTEKLDEIMEQFINELEEKEMEGADK